MASRAQAAVLLHIGLQLRFVLYGICVVLDIDLKATEIERLFADSLAVTHSPLAPTDVEQYLDIENVSFRITMYHRPRFPPDNTGD